MICSFLKEQNTLEDISSLYEKYCRGLIWKGLPDNPNTHIDPIVTSVVELKFGEEASTILEAKRMVCAIESSIGNLLERYIDSKIDDQRWIWCPGSIVKATDFIMRTKKGWEQLQIKNRSNTENSSSASVRNGTEIKKWFRFYANTGKTNWKSLSLVMGKNYEMTESDFQEYVSKLVKSKSPEQKTCLTDLFL